MAARSSGSVHSGEFLEAERLLALQDVLYLMELVLFNDAA
jgi:hypothetical protein